MREGLSLLKENLMETSKDLATGNVEGVGLVVSVDFQFMKLISRGVASLGELYTPAFRIRTV